MLIEVTKFQVKNNRRQLASAQAEIQRLTAMVESSANSALVVVAENSRLKERVEKAEQACLVAQRGLNVLTDANKRRRAIRQRATALFSQGDIAAKKMAAFLLHVDIALPDQLTTLEAMPDGEFVKFISITPC
jgi:hypothetical protein